MLIWADPIDHYGTGSTGLDNMRRAWASVGSGVAITSTARTGDSAIQIPDQQPATANVRRVFPGDARLGFGSAFGLRAPSLPSANDRAGWRYRTAAGTTVQTVVIQSDGSITVYRGTVDGTVIGVAGAGSIVAGAYQHVEYATYIDPIVGWIEIRVDMETVLRVEDINTGTDGATQFEAGGMSPFTSSVSTTLQLDDLVMWDDDTTKPPYNFVGSVRALLVFADADTEVDDWGVVGETDGYAAIDEVPPDGDTSYISATDALERSEFALPELPPEVAGIVAVYVPVFGRIEDAGIGSVRVSLVSEGLAEDGPEIPLTPAYTYRGSSFSINPDTEQPWDKASFEAGRVRIEKTA